MSSLSCHPRNYKSAAFGFCAQRGGRQSELSGDDAEAQRLIVIDNEAQFGLLDHPITLRRLAVKRKRKSSGLGGKI